jgi:hypothetical protein
MLGVILFGNLINNPVMAAYLNLRNKYERLSLLSAVFFTLNFKRFQRKVTRPLKKFGLKNSLGVPYQIIAKILPKCYQRKY